MIILNNQKLFVIREFEREEAIIAIIPDQYDRRLIETIITPLINPAERTALLFWDHRQHIVRNGSNEVLYEWEIEEVEFRKRSEE